MHFSLHRWASVACRATSWKLGWAALMLATQKGECWRLSRSDEGEKQGGGRQDLPLLTSAQGPRIVEEIFPAVEKQAMPGLDVTLFGDVLMTHWVGGELLCSLRIYVMCRDAPTNLPLLDGGCRFPGGLFFYACGENVTWVKLLELEVKQK